MDKKLKIFLPEANNLIEQMFIKRGYSTAALIGDADLVVFTGGADINPLLYNQHTHVRTHLDQGSVQRDADEQFIFEDAQELGICCVGICRGAQLLNVLNGGQMWQHVDNHGRHHDIFDTLSGEYISVSSTHHQMMIPHISGDILATASAATSLSMCNQLGDVKHIVKVHPKRGWTDIEVVLYSDTSSLCFQPHPEYGPDTCEDYFFQVLEASLLTDKG